MYKMLRNANPPKPGRPVKMFDPAEVNRWMNDHGLAVGGLEDGLSSDHIQAHAQHFRYGHCAMDLTRSVVNLYIPEGGSRNTNLKTICYMIVGDHCQPIVDADVVKSVMLSGSSRILGQRRLASGPDIKSDKVVENTKRMRSVDRVYRVERPTTQNAEAFGGEDTPVDLEYEDREEEFDDDGSQTSVRMGSGKARRTRTYPLARQVDRFVTYTKESAEGRALIKEKLRPTYWEGEDTKKWYYYVCTDDDDVEFLYEYLVRVLKLDPLRHARSYNGKCRLVEMQNVLWVANRDWESLLAVQNVLFPNEPVKMAGLGTYGFRLLAQEMHRLNPGRPMGIFECMSQYAPNLSRLMDNQNPGNRTKLLQKTFQPPYSNPRMAVDRQTVETLILWEDRHRMDVIRCYASCLRRIAESKDQYPIFDITNRIETFDESIHRGIPIGVYQVQIPERAKHDEEWTKWCCFVPGERRMMSHRMVRRLMDCELLKVDDLLLVCQPDTIRQGMYGPSLVEAFLGVVKLIYQHPGLQDTTTSKASKHLINQLVGICNGTTSALSGMRYVFHDLLHMYTLLVTSIGEDQMQRIQMKKTMGRDQYWDNTPYHYYEMTSSGLINKQFHLQPVYMMVLEEQAMLVYERMRPIPLSHIIQVHVDAVEYYVDHLVTDWRGNYQYYPWAKELQETTVSKSILDTKKTEDLWNEGLLGGWKEEEPKGKESALSYYFEYKDMNRQRSLFVTGRTVFPGARVECDNNLPPIRDFEVLEDPEDRVVVRDWMAALRVTEIGEQTRDEEYMQRLVQDWYADGSATYADRSGLLLTGPAGTGKTYVLRQIYQYGHHLGLNVLRTAFTHSACVQLGFDTQTLSSLFGIDRNNDTRMKLVFSRRFMAHLRVMRLDVLMVDEISMIPLNILECLMLYKKMHTNTRIVLGGDFNQLPPVDRQWNRSDDYNFFEYSDVFPYLLYDTVSNRNGQWWRLSECMRTDDPLLKEICVSPMKVGELVTEQRFPMPSNGTPIWRFISWRNTTRKACNWYCMERYLIHHPCRPRMVCKLRDVYVQYEMAKQGTPPRFNEEYFERMYDNQKNRPMHFGYLQDFVYVLGMEVVCRNTLRQYNEGTTEPTTRKEMAVQNVRDRGMAAVVNNRRAYIVGMNHVAGTVTLRWMDLIKRKESVKKDPEIVCETPLVVDDDELYELEPMPNEWNWADWDVVLPVYDFVFNFVPGFCITTHMAQGETIREHYGLMEWDAIKTKPKMAYVAATRGSHSQLLHIVPSGWRTDPWGMLDHGAGIDLTTQLLCRVYHINRFDKTARYPVEGFAPMVAYLTDPDNVPLCEKCDSASLSRPALYRVSYHPPPVPDVVITTTPREWYPLKLTCECCSKQMH